jgi:hypothetical protein
MQLALPVGCGVNRGSASGQQNLQRRALGSAARLGEVGAGKGVAGGSDSVDRVGLRPSLACWPGRPVKLDDQFGSLGKMCC